MVDSPKIPYIFQDFQLKNLSLLPIFQDIRFIL